MRVNNVLDDKMKKEAPKFIRRGDIGKKDVMLEMGYDPLTQNWKPPPRFH